MTRRRQRLRQNPTSVVDVALLAALGLGGVWAYQAARNGLLPNPFQELARTIFPALPGNAERATVLGWYPHPEGNTVLHFEVKPTAPAAILGTPIYYTGVLRRKLFGVGPDAVGIGNATVHFWDPDKGIDFGTALTDGDGQFSVYRPLGADELQGYRVFAEWPGSEQDRSANTGVFVGADSDPATSGIWRVRPQ